MPITLATLADATAQEVYDHIVAHLRKQGRRSISLLPRHESFSCAYRGSGGAMCAAGCLIADHEYNKETMERRSWTLLVEEGIVPSAHAKLIRGFQITHDQSTVNLWEEKFRRLATLYSLTYKEPQHENNASNTPASN